MQRGFRLLAVCIGAALAAAPVASAPKKKKTAFEELLKERAKTDYPALQAAALQRYKLAPDDRLAAFVVSRDIRIADVPAMTLVLNDMAAVLLRPWTATKPPIRVYVMADSREIAEAYSAGAIVISTGMIERMQSANALAAVLAHEIAHVLEQHEVSREKLKKAMIVAVGASSSVGVYASQGGAAKPGTAATGQLTAGSQNLLVTSYASQALLSDAMAPQMKAGQEYEADRIAADLLVLSPFSAEGEAEFFETLAKAESTRSEELESSAALISALTASRLEATVGSSGDAGKLAAGVGGLFAEAGIGGVFRKIGNDSSGEADAEKRKAKFQEYATVYGGEYPLQDEKNPEYLALAARLAAVRKSKAWAGAVQSSKAGSEAHRALLANAKAVEAASIGQPLPGPPPVLPRFASLTDNPQVPPLYDTKGALALREGQLKVAISLLEAGAQNRLFPRSGHERLAEAYLRQRDSRNAGRAIDRGVARAGEDEMFLNLMVWKAVLDNNAAKAETLAARCLVENDGAQWGVCRTRLGYDPSCKARTPEGELAFAAAKTGKGFLGAVNLAKLMRKPQDSCS